MSNNEQQNWIKYRDKEMSRVEPILEQLGFALDDKQVHIGGERYVSGGRKLVLLGKRKKDNYKVIIKVSSESDGIKEISNERKSRQILKKINFAYHVFYSPKEILFLERDNLTIFITQFIDQKCTFIERPLKEQFFLALKAFEAQEGVHVTTYEHNNLISQHFGSWKAEDYLGKFDDYKKEIVEKYSQDKKVSYLLEKAYKFLSGHQKNIDLYCDFLTHWDFVPHNIRIKGNDIYLLDYSSIRFGNKYEGWARFINFMSLYNPELEMALLDYIAKNRTREEAVALQLMRVYRLTELIWYYVNSLSVAAGNVLELNKKRIGFWANILEAVLENRVVDRNIIAEYKNARDRLRDDEERTRQEKLH